MPFPIFIPTYRRIDNQLTWHTIHPDLRKHITFVVRPDEADEMARRYAPSKVEVLPPNRQNGYIGAMQHILDINDDIFIYMDDDITSLHRKLRFFEDVTWEQENALMESRWAGEALTYLEGQRELFDALVDEADKPWVATCSPRPPHIPPLERIMRADGIMPGQHTVMMAAINAKRVKEAGVCWDDGSNNAVSDALFNLRLMDKGLDCRYDCKWGFSAVPMFGGQGGITADEGEARKQKVLEAHHELHRLFPGAVIPKKPGTRVPKTDYLNIPYIFQRKRFLLKRREELGIVVNEDDTRLAADYLAFEEFGVDWRDDENKEVVLSST